MFKILISCLATLFSINCFCAKLTIISQYKIQNIYKAPIKKISNDENKLRLKAIDPNAGCLISQEIANEMDYSLGEINILASMPNVEIKCITNGINEWGSYIATKVDIITIN